MTDIKPRPDSVPVSLYTGQSGNHYGLKTAINKQKVKGTLFLSETGFTGDECADIRHHGGPDRAIHHYPEEHYQYWKKRYPGVHKSWLAPGMGENISTRGFTENNVCIGDRFSLGTAVIEISQPRSPCFKLNRKWGIESFSADMQKLGYCGWLYRVIEEGTVTAEDQLFFMERPEQSISVQEVSDIFFNTPMDEEKLTRLLKLDNLSASWTDKIKKRLETGKLENWSFRLAGTAD